MTAKFLALFLIFAFVSEGHGDRFEMKANNGSVCMIVEMDASFQLSRDEPTLGREDAPVFTLQGGKIDTSASSCGLEGVPSLMKVLLLPKMDPLSLTFTKTDQGNVDLTVFLEFVPKDHFSSGDNTTVILEDSTPHLQVGNQPNSYVCSSEQHILLTKGIYAMTMTISNVHLQAFSVQGGGFSPAVTCDLDDVTTVGPVTGMTSVTTQPPTTGSTQSTGSTGSTGSTASTAASTAASIASIASTASTGSTESTGLTQTTQAETTVTPTTPPQTTTPPPVENNFVVKDGDVVCLAMNASFRFMIPYNNTDSKRVVKNIEVPDTARVTNRSKCDAGKNGTEQLLEIVFFEEKWTLAIRVAKHAQELDSNLRADDDFNYSWRSVELDYTLNAEQFPDVKNPSGARKPVSSGDIDGDFQGHTNGSYKCNSQNTVNLENDISLEITNMQYKAFGATDSDEFTGDVAECDADDDDDDDNHTLAIALGAGLGGLALIIVLVVIVWKVRSSGRSGYKDLDKQKI